LVEEYVSANGLSLVNHLGWVVTQGNHNQVVTTLQQYTAMSIAWANRRGQWFNMAKMESALVTRRLAHKNDFRPTLTAKI